MNEKQIYGGNKLIAETVGEKIDIGQWGENWKRVLNIHTNISEIPNYHLSWDWFVPAFNKIQKIHFDKEMCELICSHIRLNQNMDAFKTLINYIEDNILKLEYLNENKVWNKYK